jgi:hypothetical protein
MSDKRSLMGLDEEHSALQKLGLFIGTLLLGALIELTSFLTIDALKQQPWRMMAILFYEVFGLFWICVLVFIWWRPPWFRRIYLALERKLIFVIQIVVFVCALMILKELVTAWLREQGIL